MPLAYKPHTATVAAAGTTATGTEITAFTLSGSTSVTGQLTEKTPQQALEMFGVESQFPAVWLCDFTSLGSIKVGDRLTVNGRAYMVLAGPQQMDAEPITAHARYLVERYGA